jgi:hypothetical protein
MQIFDMGNTLNVHLNEEDIKHLKIATKDIKDVFINTKSYNESIAQAIRFLDWIIFEAE